ncbi:hypothetical protein ACIRPP_25300 [Streptomyces sp. NPDC101219]|uniref:hypothetical protein n=1 Tax=Streptomyces sp. NPDC101219 TaxID=3366131 RepID=UPI0038115327
MLGNGHFWAFLAVVAVLIAVPGPSVVFVVAAVALVSDSVRGLPSGTASGWFRGSPRRLSAIGAASGTVMVGPGVRPALARNDV